MQHSIHEKFQYRMVALPCDFAVPQFPLPAENVDDFLARLPSDELAHVVICGTFKDGLACWT